MNATRLVSVAAVAAFASFAAQAGTGDIYGAGFDTAVQSTRASADVRAEGTAALSAQKNFVVQQAAQPSQLSRSEVRADAVTAAHAGKIAIGNRS